MEHSVLSRVSDILLAYSTGVSMIDCMSQYASMTMSVSIDESRVEDHYLCCSSVCWMLELVLINNLQAHWHCKMFMTRQSFL